MKLPKETRRYCPYCRKHTEQVIAIAKQKTRGATHPMSRWGASRVKLRNYKSGFGNLGRFSKPAVKNWKRKTKVTRRMTIMYKCKQCGKMKGMKRSVRSGRIEIGEKIAK
mgnify:FL=1